MIDLTIIGSAIITVSGCASAVCVYVAYRVPRRLKDGAPHAAGRPDRRIPPRP